MQVQVQVHEGFPTDALVPAPTTWLIVLNPRTALVQLAPWLATLESPTVLITPNVRAAQAVAPHIPPLAVVAHPSNVATPEHLHHVVTLAPAVQVGCLVYQPQPQKGWFRYA
jgi:hypothetical protein